MRLATVNQGSDVATDVDINIDPPRLNWRMPTSGSCRRRAVDSVARLLLWTGPRCRAA